MNNLKDKRRGATPTARMHRSFRYITEVPSLNRSTTIKKPHFKERILMKNLEKITFKADKKAYKNAPFQPGFLFYKVFAADVSRLDIRIPDTLLVLKSSSHHIYTGSRGLTSTQDYKRISIYNMFMEKTVPEPGIAALRRSPDSIPANMMTSPLIPEQMYDEMLKGSLSEYVMFQRYVKCWGERPCISRVFCINDSRSNRASYGFTIANTMETYNKYTKAKSVVCSEYPMDVYPLQSKALYSLENNAKSILDFLQSLYWVRIQEIVLDFIKDASKNYWFIGCKGFKLDENVMIARELRFEKEKNKTLDQIKQERDEVRDGRLCSMQCRLCLQIYKNFEANHVLPFHMLLLYKRHTKKSGRSRLNLSHVREKGSNFLTYAVRLCRLCYMLLKKEHELILCEQRLAGIVNIHIKPDDLTKTAEFSHPAYLPSHAYQCRFLLYFDQGIENCTLKFELCGRTHKAQQIEKYMKLFYVFGASHQQVSEFCNAEAMTLWLYKNKRQIAKGLCYPFKDFQCKLECLTQEIRVKFASVTREVFELHMYAGISMDHTLNPKNLAIDIEKYRGVYMPGESFFTSDAFPEIWMELFTHDYEDKNESVYLDSSDELEEAYQPALTPTAMIANPLGSKNVLHLKYNLDPLSSRKHFVIKKTEMLNSISSILTKH